MLVKCRNIENNWIFELFYFAACAIFPHLRIFLSLILRGFFLDINLCELCSISFYPSFMYFIEPHEINLIKWKRKCFKRAKIEFNFMKFNLRGCRLGFEGKLLKIIIFLSPLLQKILSPFCIFRSNFPPSCTRALPLSHDYNKNHVFRFSPSIFISWFNS